MGRSIVTGAIDESLMAFPRILGATVTPDTDLDRFQLMTDQLNGLIALLRTVQHDHGEGAVAPVGGCGPADRPRGD